MIPKESGWRHWIAWAAFGATASNFASITLAHACLALGIALLLARPRLARAPAVMWPALALIAWTLVAVAFSDEPSSAYPQVKKLVVFAILPLTYTAFRTTGACQRVVQAWFSVAFGACALALAQFARAVLHAVATGDDFYRSYVGERITGFHSHWLTFSHTAVLVMVTLACYLLFARRRPGFRIWGIVAAVIGAALVLSFTRSAWLALLASGLYMLAVAKPRLLAVGPIVLAIAYLVAPNALQQQMESIRPGANQSRIVMWRTGVNMIKAHPITGVGPERAGPLFPEYKPEDVVELPTGFYGHLHNVFIHFAAERGIPAAIIVMWLFLQVLVDMRRGLRRTEPGRDDRRFQLHAGAAATLAIVILSCFDVSLGDSEVLGAYLAIVAVAYRGLPEGREAPERSGSASRES